MTKRPILLALLFLPILLFFTLCARQTVNLPFLDDYDGTLHFVSLLTHIPTVSGRILYTLTAQHNEYKLIFANILFALQFYLTGTINFAVLSTIGNLLLLPIFLLLALLWRDDRRPIQHRLLLLVPTAWVFFQLQYYSLLNWPMSSLQHIAIVTFALATIYLIGKDTQPAFVCALVTLAVAMASSGNGILLIPLCSLMLIQFRQWTRLATWLLLSVLLIAGYFYHYNTMSSQAHADHSVVSSIHHLSPTYALAFVGASITRYESVTLAAAFGLALTVVFLFALRDKLFRTNPALFYSMLFVLITAAAVSGLRSDLGMNQALVSRYRIYSNLMTIFAYFFLIGKVQFRLRTPLQRRAVGGLIALAVLAFSAGSTFAGYKLLRIRTALTAQGLQRWQRGETSITVAPGPPNEDPVIKRQRAAGIYAPDGKYLVEAAQAHIYNLPPL